MLAILAVQSVHQYAMLVMTDSHMYHLVHFPSICKKVCPYYPFLGLGLGFKHHGYKTVLSSISITKLIAIVRYALDILFLI